MHASNPQVKELAALIERTPSSVTLKLGNLASFDPALQARGIRGAPNASKLDKVIWDEFYNNWDAALLESERLLAQRKHTTIETENNVATDDIPKEGLDKERLVMTRVNQSIFRKIVLATYNSTCCMTGIQHPELLVASHIIPWRDDSGNRLNPTNGLCLNALHDKAFDRGLITVDANSFRVRVSEQLMDVRHFSEVDGMEIKLPDKFLPKRELLQLHNDSFRM